MMHVPPLLSDQGCEMSKSGESSDRGISFSEVHLFVAFTDWACFASYGVVMIVFRLVDQF